MTKEKVIDKVKKLLAMTESEYENEAESAMLKAQELLAKHQLTMKDIDLDNDKSGVEENII